MKVEDLIKILKDAGLEDEAIKVLLEEALKSFDPIEEKPIEDKKDEVEIVENEDDKMKRVFGI